MNRIDRLTAIIIQLQSKRFVHVQEITERYNISERTVYRDLKALEEAGVPIGNEAGKGYFIVAGYHLPPVMFTRNEASALILAEKVLEKFADSSVIWQYQQALTKIKSILRGDEKLYVEELDTHISIEPYSFPKPVKNYLFDVLKAITSKQLINIDYHAVYNDKITKNRPVEPFGVIYYSFDWHIIGFCRLRNDFRDFKLGRIKKLQLTSHKFEKHDEYSLQEYFNKFISSNMIIRVIVQFDNSLLSEISSQKYYYGFLSEKESKNFIEITFATNSLDYIAKWLISFRDKVEIVSPVALKKTLETYALEIKNKYLK